MNNIKIKPSAPLERTGIVGELKEKTQTTLPVQKLQKFY